MSKPLSTGQLAARLDVCDDTIRNWIREGKIPYTRTDGGHYRFDLNEVRNALAGRWAPAPPRSRCGPAAERMRLQGQARQQAFAALARRHAGEYRQLYQAELEYLGVTDMPAERPCECGGTIRRTTAYGPWPKRCDACNPRGAYMRRWNAARYQQDKARISRLAQRRTVA